MLVASVEGQSQKRMCAKIVFFFAVQSSKEDQKLEISFRGGNGLCEAVAVFFYPFSFFFITYYKNRKRFFFQFARLVFFSPCEAAEP